MHRASPSQSMKRLLRYISPHHRSGWTFLEIQFKTDSRKGDDIKAEISLCLLYNKNEKAESKVQPWDLMTYTMEEKNSKRDISHPRTSELHLIDVGFVENHIQLGFFLLWFLHLWWCPLESGYSRQLARTAFFGQFFFCFFWPRKSCNDMTGDSFLFPQKMTLLPERLLDICHFCFAETLTGQTVVSRTTKRAC